MVAVRRICGPSRTLTGLQLEPALAFEVREIEIVGEARDFAIPDDENAGDGEHDLCAVVHGEVVDALGEHQARFGRQGDDSELRFCERVEERLKDRADTGDALDRCDRRVVVDASWANAPQMVSRSRPSQEPRKSRTSFSLACLVSNIGDSPSGITSRGGSVVHLGRTYPVLSRYIIEHK